MCTLLVLRKVSLGIHYIIIQKIDYEQKYQRLDWDWKILTSINKYRFPLNGETRSLKLVIAIHNWLSMAITVY